MTGYSSTRTVAILFVGASICANCAFAQTSTIVDHSAAGQNPSASSGISDIIVTAQRRE
jgi:hypothetical protein